MQNLYENTLTNFWGYLPTFEGAKVYSFDYDDYDTNKQLEIILFDIKERPNAKDIEYNKFLMRVCLRFCGATLHCVNLDKDSQIIKFDIDFENNTLHIVTDTNYEIKATFQTLQDVTIKKNGWF